MVLGGPYFPPWMVRGDQVFCRGRSGGPILGGNNYRMTTPHSEGLIYSCTSVHQHVHIYIFTERPTPMDTDSPVHMQEPGLAIELDSEGMDLYFQEN